MINSKTFTNHKSKYTTPQPVTINLHLYESVFIKIADQFCLFTVNLVHKKCQKVCFFGCEREVLYEIKWLI